MRAPHPNAFSIIGKSLLAKLPNHWLLSLRALRARNLIKRGKFHAGEPEFDLLSDWLRPGDWALDIGANIGTYSIRMSHLVGDDGRVIAFEPVLETFSLLTSNLIYAGCRNVTAINAAASNKVSVLEMRIPLLSSGLENHYQATIASAGQNTKDRAIRTMALKVGTLGLEHRIALVKVDAEGHEHFVLEGMRDVIVRDRPVLVLETTGDPVEEWLLGLGYRIQRFHRSPNTVFIPSET